MVRRYLFLRVLDALEFPVFDAVCTSGNLLVSLISDSEEFLCPPLGGRAATVYRCGRENIKGMAVRAWSRG
jgi:predicted RNA-binding Zn-ribbon protein involved in translation (DUF1610 family)